MIIQIFNRFSASTNKQVCTAYSQIPAILSQIVHSSSCLLILSFSQRFILMLSLSTQLTSSFQLLRLQFV